MSGATAIAPRQGLAHRHLTSTDVSDVTCLLSVLPQLYPNGEQWLKDRLLDALDGRARCTLATQDGILAGAAIETPKPNNRLKLSTFFVANDCRGQGIGSFLLDQLHSRWTHEAIDEVYVTIASNVYDDAQGTFNRGGFTLTALQKNRYGSGRHEHVMACLPSL